MPDTISPQEASALLAEGKATFLDVRRKADKEADPEMIPGAVWHDPEPPTNSEGNNDEQS